ncbi:hypothetical protein AMTR_s00142p00046160 [Amborella trichopoda]|uniref:Uncharacterized protein n=1 Tax=Amborella trichopoda TaxID=13333 RepID=W1PG25_AMBTC|nr:hypothetical protein AMTR_s00142p00046160 [Amborella trichopoda]
MAQINTVPVPTMGSISLSYTTTMHTSLDRLPGCYSLLYPQFSAILQENPNQKISVESTYQLTSAIKNLYVQSSLLTNIPPLLLRRIQLIIRFSPEGDFILDTQKNLQVSQAGFFNPQEMTFDELRPGAK